ncbi:MAG: hypothetical protein ACPHK0_02795 [Dehalococcoidia bacterium]
MVTGPAADEASALGSELGTVLLVSTLAFTFLFIFIVQHRYKIRSAEDDLVEIKRSADLSAATGA